MNCFLIKTRSRVCNPNFSRIMWNKKIWELSWKCTHLIKFKKKKFLSACAKKIMNADNGVSSSQRGNHHGSFRALSSTMNNSSTNALNVEVAFYIWVSYFVLDLSMVMCSKSGIAFFFFFFFRWGWWRILFVTWVWRRWNPSRTYKCWSCVLDLSFFFFFQI